APEHVIPGARAASPSSTPLPAWARPSSTARSRPTTTCWTARTPGERGCLTPARLQELREAGERLQRRLGAPQDLEWAYDRDGTLWLLQSRPITTLFPAPPASAQPGPRIYVEFGHVQGMLQPVTPMGLATLKALVAGMLASFGMTIEIVDIGGRLYGDLTDAIRAPST